MDHFNVNPPKGLLEKILNRIHREERLFFLRRIVIYSGMLAASLLGFLPSFNALTADFGRSGFMNFFSLAFTDFSSIISHWQSFAMILLETLPVISLALFLAVVLVFLESLKYLIKNIKAVSGGSHMAVAR